MRLGAYEDVFITRKVKRIQQEDFAIHSNQNIVVNMSRKHTLIFLNKFMI